MTKTKYQTKQEQKYNLLGDAKGIDNLIDSANYFSMSPEVQGEFRLINEQAKQMAQK